MDQLHAYEVLHMMEGNNYTEKTLRNAIIERFGENQLFYACSADHMNIDQLTVFLRAKGKFMDAVDTGFTVDITKVCDHQ